MPDETRAARAPSGTHDVLWPESTRWESLVATFASQVEAAAYGLAHTPIFEDARVFRRGIGEGSDVVGKEMYEFEDRGGRTLALRPEGTAPLVRAFVQHRPPLPWKAWYVTPAFRYERPQAGRYRQHHQLGVEALGSARSRPRRRGRSRWPTGSSVPSGWPRSTSGSTRWATASAAPATSTLLRAYLDEHRDELCAEHRERLDANPLRVLDCKREECRAAIGRGPPPHRPPVRARAASTSIGSAPASTRSACPTGSTTAWSGGSTTTPGPPSSSRPGPSSRPRTGSAAVAATTGWWRCSAGPRRRASASGSASSGSCWPATPKGCSPSTPPPLDAFVVDVAGGRSARDITAELRRAGLRADRAFDGRSMKSQLKSADRSGAGVALIVGPDELAAGTVSLRPMRGTGEQRTVLRSEVVQAVRDQSGRG